MKVSVVIPAYNEEKFIGSCLRALLKQTEKADEIIVVDNNSTDGTARIAKEMGAIVVKEENQGMIYARNRGFNEVQYEIIARLDADTIVKENWIEKIKSNFEKDNIVAVSGPGLYYDLPRILQFKHWPFRIYAILVKKTLKMDFLFGPNMAIKKSAWEKIKGEVCLNDNDVHEDIDLTLHIAKVGKTKLDYSLAIETSARRLKNIYSFYIEYPLKLRKTFKKHSLLR
jgi:glycosyltransferase involved in cell wall biosynthesis